MRKDMTEVIQYLIIHLCWFDFTNSRFEKLWKLIQHFRILIDIISWCVAVVCLSTEGFWTNFNGKYYLLIVTLLSCNHSLAIAVNNKRAVKIVNTFRKLFSEQNEYWQETLMHKDARNILRAVIVYESTLGTIATFYFIIPIIYDIGLAIFSPDAKMFKVPLPFDALLSGQVRSFRNYSIILLNIRWSVEAMLMQSGSFAIFGIFTMYLATQFKILTKKVDIFTTIIEKKNSHGNSTLSGEEKQALNEIVKHHTILIGIAEELKISFGFSLANQNTLCSLSICITMITSLNLFERQAYFLIITNSIRLFFMTLVVFGPNFLGEYVQTQNTKLYHAISNVPWYTFNSKTARDINLMMTHASRERIIDFHGLSPMSLHTFMQVMNTAYSYFTVLKSML